MAFPYPATPRYWGLYTKVPYQREEHCESIIAFLKC